MTDHNPNVGVYMGLVLVVSQRGRIHSAVLAAGVVVALLGGEGLTNRLTHAALD